MRRASELSKQVSTSQISKHDSHLGATESAESGHNSPEKRTTSLHKTGRETTLQGTPKVEILDDSTLIWPAGVKDEEFIKRWLRQSDCIM